MALRSSSTAALRAELARREKGAAKLTKKRDSLAAVIADLEATLADFGVDGIARRGRRPGRPAGRRGPGRPPGRRGPGRPRGVRSRNKQSLAAALAAGVRPGSVVSPAQAASIVRSRGYKTTAQKFGMAVAHTLATHKGFRRKGRGQYERVATG